MLETELAYFKALLEQYEETCIITSVQGQRALAILMEDAIKRAKDAKK